MRIILHAIVLTLFSAFSLQAQHSKLKKAAEYMESLNYIGAIKLYEDVLRRSDAFPEAKVNLAEAYRKIGDSKNAEHWYAKVVLLPESKPEHKLYYGQMLHRNGKCQMAEKWFKQYILFKPEDRRGANLASSCDKQQELMSKGISIFEVETVDFNTPKNEISPAFYKNGLIYSSDRSEATRKHSWTGNPFLDLFFVKGKRDTSGLCGIFEFSKPEKFSKSINSRNHEASITFNKELNEIYFTRNGDPQTVGNKKIIPLKIVMATADDAGEWKKFDDLPFCSNEYSVAHPTLSVDGEKLYFASDMPGGYGGMDLYVSERKYGIWGPPVNLGANINTEGNELFPFYEKNGRLYFSSDGHIGLGGLDIYFVEDKGNDNWGRAENVGYPINSISDDFSIIFNESSTCGFFTSNREGGKGGDDIYTFTKSAVRVKFVAFDAVTGQYIEHTSIKNKCTNEEFSTDVDGVRIIEMPVNKCCNFKIQYKGYEPITKEVCTLYIGAGETLPVELPLSKNVDLMVSGVIFDQSNGLPISGATVNLNTSGCDIPESIVTDPSGRFSFELDKNCCYWIRAEKPNFFTRTDNEEICTRNIRGSEYSIRNIYLQPYLRTGNQRVEVPGTYFNAAKGKYMDLVTGQMAEGGYGEYTLRAGNLIGVGSFSGFKRSATTFDDGNYTVSYIIDISFDDHQSNLRGDAISELEKLQQLMLDNPGLIIEVGSHTDAKGPDEYNLKLSQARANAIATWLKENGVPGDRVFGKGYGEKRLLNRCKNGVPCTELEHNVNRRTEFRVVGCLNCEKEVFSTGSQRRG